MCRCGSHMKQQPNVKSLVEDIQDSVQTHRLSQMQAARGVAPVRVWSCSAGEIRLTD